MNAPRALLRLTLGRRLPTATGTVRVPGLSGRATVRRDRHGVPHIDADSDADAWFALGFCHGQDRAFQLEIYRRVAAGTLSELVGPAGLPVDRLARRAGYTRASLRQLEALDPDVRATLDAYARGVNAGATLGQPRRPHEYAILGGTFGGWSAADTLGYLKVQSLLIGSNWDVELARLQLLLADGREAVEALDPASALNGPMIDPRGKEAVWRAAERLAADLRALAATVPAAAGSNSWAIAGSRTKSGRPLLANDPHVGPSVPTPWYLAHLTTPTWSACGATPVGIPGFAAGHNGTAAWGCTAALTDTIDLVLEEVGPDGVSVRGPNGWERCEVVEEVIRVKGAADVAERVLITPRGPVVSPSMEGVTSVFSMRAVWLDPLPVRGATQAHRSKTFAQFRESYREWPLVPQHFVYADAAGNLGWQLAGQTPRRGAHHGLVPQTAAAGGGAWGELVPFEGMPHGENPPAGFYATANNPPLPEGEGPYLGDDWVSGYRAGVITDALAARTGWDVAACQALQLSRRCKPWEELREAVLAAATPDADAARGLALLRSWDGQLLPDRPAASVYVFFMSKLAERIARAKAPNGWEWALGKGFGGLVPHTLFADRRFAHVVKLVREQPPGWFPRPWPVEIGDALGDGVRALDARSKQKAESARWGHVRPLKIKHFAFGDIRGLSAAFNLGPVPCGGDSNTPFQGTVQPLDPLADPAYTPTFRMVIDVGAWENSRFSLAGGQSGNPCSPHYADLLPLWERGDGVPIAWTPAEVQAATVATLTLEPV